MKKSQILNAGGKADKLLKAIINLAKAERVGEL